MEKEEQFAVISEYYDRMNGADYKAYADFVQNIFRTHGTGKEELLLDLACGTGKLTCELASRGYDMIGADISIDMLNVARDRAYDGEFNILYLLQDMREFELYGTVDGIVCSLDGVSYLSERKEVIKCLKLARNYLNPGAMFVFDVNTEHRLREVLDGREYFIEDGDVYLGWHSEVNGDFCDFYLTLFIEGSDGRYMKKSELQSERIWSMDEYKSMISESGLELTAVYSDLEMSAENDISDKWYFVCRCPWDDKG